MSLLSICQSVTGEVGWPVPTSIVGNSDGTAIQLLTLANTELRALSEMFDWPQLEVEYPFQTVIGQAVYLWPADFRVLAHDSAFNADQYYSLRGSLGIPYWQLNKYGHLSSLSRQAFRVVYPLGAPGIEISPAPAYVANLVAVYYSNAYALSSGAGKPLYTADADVSKVPERLVELGVKWRFRRAKGLDFSVEYADYNNTVSTQLAKYKSTESIPVGGRRPLPFDTVGLTPGYVRDYGYGT